MLPAKGALVGGEGLGDGWLHACDFLGMSCILERFVPHPEAFVCLSTGNIRLTSCLGLFLVLIFINTTFTLLVQEERLQIVRSNC